MAEDHSQPDRLLSEASPLPSQEQQHEKTGSVPIGIPPAGEDASAAVNGDAVKLEAPPIQQPDPYNEQANAVINSDVSNIHENVMFCANDMRRLEYRYF
jgi:hypothetical protein